MTGTYDGGFQEWTCDDSSLQAVDSSQIRKGKSCRMLIFFCTVAHRNVVRRDAFTFGVWHVLPLLFLNRKITQLRLQWHLIYRCRAECYANSNGTIFFFFELRGWPWQTRPLHQASFTSLTNGTCPRIRLKGNKTLGKWHMTNLDLWFGSRCVCFYCALSPVCCSSIAYSS